MEYTIEGKTNDQWFILGSEATEVVALQYMRDYRRMFLDLPLRVVEIPSRRIVAMNEPNSREIHFQQVTEARYDDMLGVVPPAIHRADSFLVGEPWTHKRCTVTGLEDQPAFAAFVRRDGRCWEADEAMTASEFRALDPRMSRIVGDRLTFWPKRS